MPPAGPNRQQNLVDHGAIETFIYRARRPGPALRPHMESLWYACGRVPYTEERILPNGRTSLMINLSDPFHVRQSKSPAKNERLNKDAWICGLQQGYILNRPLGATHMVGVTFRPGGVKSVLGYPAHDFADRFVDLDLLWGRMIEHLRDQLHTCPTIADKLDVFENALVQQMRTEGKQQSPYPPALRLLGGRQRASLSDLADASGFSRQHLRRLCLEAHGATPQMMIRLARFNDALNLLQGPSPSLAAISHGNGYYDQAHFNRDFRSFAGMSPSDYLALRHRHYGARGEQDETRSFVPVA